MPVSGLSGGGDEGIEAERPTGARHSGAAPAWPPPACPPSLRVSLLSEKECGQTVSKEVGVMNPQENRTGGLWRQSWSHGIDSALHRNC